MERTFTITGMDCADCARTVEKGVAQLDQVESCTLNYTVGKLRVAGGAEDETMMGRVRQLGYNVAENDSADTPAASAERGGFFGFIHFLRQRRSTTLALIGALLILPGLFFEEILPLFTDFHPPSWVNLFALAALAVAGYPIALSAWRTLRINREISINLLMTIAALGALVIGAYSEAGLVMVLFAIGEALKGYTMERARQSIHSLLSVSPNEAILLRPCIHCQRHMGKDFLQAGWRGSDC